MAVRAPRIIFTAYKWQIDDFNQRISIVEKNGSIFSDLFLLNGNSEAEFSTKLEHKGTDLCDLKLVCDDFGRKQTINLNAKSWWKCAKGEVGAKIESKSMFSKASDTALLAPGYLISDLKELAIDDTLQFYCEIKHEERSNEFDADDEKEEFVVRREFDRKMLVFHLNGHLDKTVIIQAGGEEFKANNLKLMACSNVFRKIFLRKNSTEAKAGILQIEDTEPEVIDALIDWIYQTEVYNMKEVAMELYRVADKYDIGLLKKKCAKIMTKGLSIKNIAPRLILACNFNDGKLKKYITDFLRKDSKILKRVAASDEWLKFKSEDPEEAKDVLAEISD
jgi:hypothetical protein